MVHLSTLAAIGELGADRVGESDLAITRAQQQKASVRGLRRGVELGHDGLEEHVRQEDGAVE